MTALDKAMAERELEPGYSKMRDKAIADGIKNMYAYECWLTGYVSGYNLRQTEVMEAVDGTKRQQGIHNSTN